MGLKDGLVACWLFEQSGGNIAHDYSGNGNHGQIIGSVKRRQKGGHWSLVFNQSDTQYVNVPNCPALRISAGVTWIWQTSGIRSNRVGLGLLCHQSGALSQAYNRFYLATTQHRITFESCCKIGSAASRRTAYLSNGNVTQRHQFAYTYDGAVERLYIDGVKKCEVALSGFTQTGNANLNVGRKAHNRKWQFYGDLDLCIVWNRALDDQELIAAFSDPYGIVRGDGMAFHHLAGITTQGAIDPVADWFATFEAWISAVVGWTVAAGAGTTNLILSSVGESGLRTKLFVNIYRVGATGQIRAEVRDDLAGTHRTNEGGYWQIDCRVRYWMSADLDCIIIAIHDTYRMRLLYLGLLEPVANNPIDETYHSVAMGQTYNTASILRNSAGAWDVDIANFWATYATGLCACPLDGTYPLQTLYADRQNVCAGQYKFLSAPIGYMALTPHDELSSAVTGGTSQWKVFHGASYKYAMMTDPGQPGAVADGAHFAHQTGVVNVPANFISVTLPPFMVGIGWQDLGDPGGPSLANRLFYSQGESGTEHIYILVCWGLPGNWEVYVQDDAVGTHRTAICMSQQFAFPNNYWMSADRDCLMMIFTDGVARDCPLWCGRLKPDTPLITDATYLMATYAPKHVVTPLVLRTHHGAWYGIGAFSVESAVFQNGNANAYDPTTYLVCPHFVMDDVPGTPGIRMDIYGTAKYYMYTNGGGIAQYDTITVGAQQYTVFDRGVGVLFAMRCL